jgi:hypothetical protein
MGIRQRAFAAPGTSLGEGSRPPCRHGRVGADGIGKGKGGMQGSIVPPSGTRGFNVGLMGAASRLGVNDNGLENSSAEVAAFRWSERAVMGEVA